MARIEEKSKEKLSSVIWTWIIVGVLSAVVITGIVLGIIYLVNLNNGDETDKEYVELYPDANLISWEDLDASLEPGVRHDLHPDGSVYYVYIYSPATEIKDSDKAIIEAASGNDAFYILNITAEDNEEYVLANSNYLTELEDGKSYLLIIERNPEFEITEKYTGKEIFNNVPTE